MSKRIIQYQICEDCQRHFDADAAYILNDQGTLRYFCKESHADAYLKEKYQMPFPFLGQVPCSNYGTNGGMQDA